MEVPGPPPASAASGRCPGCPRAAQGWPEAGHVCSHHLESPRRAEGKRRGSVAWLAPESELDGERLLLLLTVHQHQCLPARRFCAGPLSSWGRHGSEGWSSPGAWARCCPAAWGNGIRILHLQELRSPTSPKTELTVGFLLTRATLSLRCCWNCFTPHWIYKHFLNVGFLLNVCWWFYIVVHTLYPVWDLPPCPPSLFS